MLTATALVLVVMNVASFDDAARVRVQEHLWGAEQLLYASTPPGLNDAQLRRRALNIERLRVYRERGVFPQNPDFDQLTPYFIDDRGTRCAMAHLIEASGHAGFVAKVARQRNNAYVRELVNEPELVAWLSENGMTVDEAARVQPQYSPRCGKYRALAFCSYPAENAAELRVLETPADGGEPLIRIERVFFGTLEDTVGSEHRAPQLTSSRISVDNRLFASGVGRARRYDQPESEGFFSASNVEPISSDGRVSTSLDSACATPPSAPVDALAEAMTLAEEPCVNALVAVDPGFGEELCYRDGISSQAHCGPDGELRSEVLPGPLGCTCGTSGGQAAALAMFTLLLRFRFRPARRA